MNYLIIYTHPNNNSFSNAILDKVVSKLTSENQQVTVRDLYALDFNPVLKPLDFDGIKTGNIPEEIRIEQEFIRAADVFIFIYPVWWGAAPALTDQRHSKPSGSLPFVLIHMHQRNASSESI